MSATIRPEPVKLKENVTLVFTNVQVSHPFVVQFCTSLLPFIKKKDREIQVQTAFS